jgi:ADP-ribose pyrophosphatase
MIKPWRILNRKILYSAPPYIELSVETVELPDGRVIRDYHHLAAGTFVTIVAETGDGKIMAFNQYRHGVRRVGLGLPGGRIDAGEEPLEAAQRELLEETGSVAASWKLISAWDTSCTYGFTKNHYFHAKGVRQVRAPVSDDLEQSELIYLSRAEIVRKLREGGFISIGHAAPLALLLISEMTPPA